MGDVLPFRAAKKARQSTLCREGHHRWRVETKSRFDVKQGKLVTVYRCARCGDTKTTAH